MPKVSVIIPAYNPGAFLRETIVSVHRQTFLDWELVVIDDGSVEDLSWVLFEFPNVKVISQPNSGVSVARNNGILQTSGEYIAFMDQDDVWLPEKLKRQVAAMDEISGAAVCYCDLELINGHGEVIGMGETAVQSRSGDLIVELDTSESGSEDSRSPMHRSLAHFSARFVVPSTVMMRRSALATSGLLDPFIPFSGDYDLLIKLGSRHKVIRVPHADVLYRKHANNFSDRYEIGRLEVAALISRYESYAKSKNDQYLFKSVKSLLGRPSSIYAAQAYDCARRALGNGATRMFFIHLKNAFCFSPLFVTKSLAAWGRSKFNAATSATPRSSVKAHL